MSGKGNASLNRGRSAVDVTMDSNDDGTENVNTQPALEDPPSSQQNEPIENDDESDDEDDIPFYQYTFSSDGQVQGYGTPSPQALNIASLLATSSPLVLLNNVLLLAIQLKSVKMAILLHHHQIWSLRKAKAWVRLLPRPKQPQRRRTRNLLRAAARRSRDMVMFY